MRRRRRRKRKKRRKGEEETEIKVEMEMEIRREREGKALFLCIDLYVSPLIVSTTTTDPVIAGLIGSFP